MSQKSNVTALWFIPLVSLFLAGIFTIVGVLGWQMLRPTVSKKESVASASVSNKGAVNQPNPASLKSKPAVEDAVAARFVFPATGQSFSPARDRFEQAFVQCLERDTYPCTWQDTQDGVLKQFAISKKDGIIVRNIHRLDNTPVSQTAISRKGQVLLYHQDNTTWYFDNAGVVRHISVGTIPNAKVKDPRDSYFYDVNGQLNSCVCADNTTTCCAHAPQLPQGTGTYCGLFAPDAELCPLP